MKEEDDGRREDPDATVPYDSLDEPVAKPRGEDPDATVPYDSLDEPEAKVRSEEPDAIVPPDFLNEPVAKLDIPAALQSSWRATELAGTTIGRYQLLDELGEGGFGVVYVAEQLEPVKRRVALKVIKPGMDSREVIVRFEAERQALALMDHPNVAQVYDGGATEEGRPYFVMELVAGEPITQYCDKNKLSVRRRLDLFMKVCAAVQHAHQKGIIHRDLKPSNILVSAQEGEAVPKVIDFGIAKAISQELTDKTLFTKHGQLMGTPQYMSPEQAGINAALDVDTQSDIYSLGVVLYELLTGTTPMDPKRLRSAGYAEMERIILEEEPPKPSTRISTMGDDVVQVAMLHGSEPRKFGKLIRGELDWIVMKALEKDRTRRYVTASALATDIVRYLNDEPVEASPPSATYRVGKFVKRYRGPVAAVAAVFVTLVGGVAVSSWQMVEARRARSAEEEQKNAAEGERKKAERSLLMIDDAHQRATALAADMLVALQKRSEAASEGDGRESPSAHGLEAALDEARGVVDSFYNTAEAGNYDDRRHMKSVILDSKGDLARRLEDLSGAEENYRQSLEIREDLRRRNPERALHLHNLAMSYEKLGDLHFAMAAESGNKNDEFSEALDFHRDSLELSRQLVSRPDAEPYWLNDVAVSHYKIAMALLQSGERKAALKELLEGYKVAEEVAESDPDYSEWQADLGLYCLRIGERYAEEARDVEAQPYLKRGKEIFDKLRRRNQLKPAHEAWHQEIEILLEVVGNEPPEEASK